ncbi:MAG: leucine-rich repeat domain-containing protein [Clostridiales bacterium]|nr:leucine-rich repeat domain-containing protein [Clostridiales bacterium]
MKKTIAALMAVMLILSIAACGKKTVNTVDTTEASEVETTALVEESSTEEESTTEEETTEEETTDKKDESETEEESTEDDEEEDEEESSEEETEVDLGVYANDPDAYFENGVIFKKTVSKDKKGEKTESITLLKYPKDKGDKEYYIPQGTKYVEHNAFSGVSNLEKLYVPSTVEHLGENDEGFVMSGLFNGCSKLKTVQVEKANKHYASTDDGLLICRDRNDGIVIYLPGRRELVYRIPDSVETIEFYGNSRLERIRLGANVRSLMVDNCPSLNAFVGKNDKGYYTKDNCLFKKWVADGVNALIYYPQGKRNAKYSVPDGTTGLYGALEFTSDSAFNSNPYIKEITLPDSLTFIGCGAFKNCTKLEKIKFPETLEYIGDSAFRGCTSLKTITLYPGLKSLGYYDGPSSYALLKSSITDIYFMGMTKQWESIVNSDPPAKIPKSVTVHCMDSDEHFARNDDIFLT